MPRSAHNTSFNQPQRNNDTHFAGLNVFSTIIMYASPSKAAYLWRHELCFCMPWGDNLLPLTMSLYTIDESTLIPAIIFAWFQTIDVNIFINKHFIEARLSALLPLPEEAHCLALIIVVMQALAGGQPALSKRSNRRQSPMWADISSEAWALLSLGSQNFMKMRAASSCLLPTIGLIAPSWGVQQSLI